MSNAVHFGHRASAVPSHGALLYHSFPRHIAGRFEPQEVNEIGVQQLSLIRKYGLLLTPEFFEIPDHPYAARREGKSAKKHFLQVRACFTLMERGDLWVAQGRDPARSHVDSFGPFTIGMKSSDGRRMGAVPVYYVYDAFEPSDDLSDDKQYSQEDVNLTKEIRFGLRDLRSLAIAVARLEAKAANPKRNSLDTEMLNLNGYVLEGDPVIQRRIEQVDRQTARAVVDLLDTDRDPAWNLVDLIEIMLSLFQKTDYHPSDPYRQIQMHAYFKQREWRIVRLYQPRLRCQRLGPDGYMDADQQILPDERDELRGCLRKHNESWDDGYLNGCAILRGTSGADGSPAKDFFDFVKEVICPSDAADEVAELIKPDGFVCVVSRNEAGQSVFKREADR